MNAVMCSELGGDWMVGPPTPISVPIRLQPRGFFVLMPVVTPSQKTIQILPEPGKPCSHVLFFLGALHPPQLLAIESFPFVSSRMDMTLGDFTLQGVSQIPTPPRQETAIAILVFFTAFAFTAILLRTWTRLSIIKRWFIGKTFRSHT